jgi:uncharacterized membrane protein HdeD (DUF308 family)
MSRSLSTSLIVRGVLAAIVGIVAIAWPGVTILALVILFAVYAFMDAGLEGTRAFTSRTAGPVFGHLIVAVIDVGAGIFAIVWPGPTALVLVIVVAAWAFVGGFFEIFAAFQSGERAGTRALFLIGGLISILFGIVLAARPGVGVLTLALLFGLYSLIFGVSQVVMGIEAHRTGKSLHAVMADAA